MAEATDSPPRRRPREPLAPGLRLLLRLPPGLLRQRLWYDLRKPLFASGLYRLLLPNRIAAGPAPKLAADNWPGNAAHGSAIIQGIFSFAGQTIRDPAPLWAPVGAQAAWLEALHGFDWLRDLRAVGGEQSRQAARQLIGRWIDDNSRWGALAWRPDLIGRRLTAWLSHHEFLGIGGDALFRGRFHLSVARQASHLARALPGGLAGSALIIAIAGLIHAGLALPRGAGWLARGSGLLERELKRQFLADGGHAERSPSVELALLRLFIGLRAGFAAADREAPAGLDAAIDGLTRMLRFLQHGDGGLALFNDSNEEEDWLVDMALARADGKGLMPREAPESGFQRLVANRTLVLVDCGVPPPAGFDNHAHAGTLAFEMSIGRERLVVNCGAFPGRGNWWAAQRSTAAHSTLVVDETNSSVFSPAEGLLRGPRQVPCQRDEAEGNLWLEANHDGYLAPFGLVHHRRLYLGAGGDDLRGEDRLTGNGKRPFVIRFHLHPEVSASMVQNGQAVLLRLASGAGWRLRATGGEISLADSIYLGRRGETRRTQQIVVAGQKADEEAIVKWALTRETKPPKPR
jgi:uncharacterized heparinase superfamily protein